MYTLTTHFTRESLLPALNSVLAFAQFPRDIHYHPYSVLQVSAVIVAASTLVYSLDVQQHASGIFLLNWLKHSHPSIWYFRMIYSSIRPAFLTFILSLLVILSHNLLPTALRRQLDSLSCKWMDTISGERIWEWEISGRRFMSSSLLGWSYAHSILLTIYGAPERIWDRCCQGKLQNCSR